MKTERIVSHLVDLVEEPGHGRAGSGALRIVA
jgi:hypothetical protein